jgi:hypothetical protein
MLDSAIIFYDGWTVLSMDSPMPIPNECDDLTYLFGEGWAILTVQGTLTEITNCSICENQGWPTISVQGPMYVPYHPAITVNDGRPIFSMELPMLSMELHIRIFPD